MQVNLLEAKDRLAELSDQVRAGEEVIIAETGKMRSAWLLSKLKPKASTDVAAARRWSQC